MPKNKDKHRNRDGDSRSKKKKNKRRKQNDDRSSRAGSGRDNHRSGTSPGEDRDDSRASVRGSDSVASSVPKSIVTATETGGKKPADPWTAQFRTCIRQQLWNDRKFLTSEKQAKSTAVKICKSSNIRGCHEDTPEAAANRAQLADEKHMLVQSMFNNQRSNVQGRMKTACANLIKDNKTLPTPDTIIQCALRDTECDRDAFVFFWDVLLPKCVLIREQWGREVRWFNRISVAAPDEFEHITPSTEAFAACVYKNCYQKWHRLVELGLSNTKNLQILETEDQVRKKKKSKDTQCMSLEKEPKLAAEWTQSGKGQTRWTGWKTEGAEFYKDLAKQCEQNRNERHNEALEQEVLELVKAKHDIAADCTLEEWQSGKKGRKKKANTASNEVENLWDESDDECAAFL